MSSMNVYEKNREQRATELKTLLCKVAKEALHVMKKIPEENFSEYLKKGNGSCVYFEWDNYEEGKLEVYFNIWFDGIKMIERSWLFDYDNTSVKELEDFVRMYYPGFYVERGLTFNLKDRAASFGFGFDLEYDNDNSKHTLGTGITSKSIDASLKIFNEDVTELLKHDFSTDSWKELLICYNDCEDVDKIEYYHGYTEVDISIDE